jgi:hypothetical protein
MYVVATPKATMTAAPGSHHVRGIRRMSATAAAAPPAAKTAPMPHALTRSPAQSGQSWVDRPTSTARWWATALSGSGATFRATESTAPAPAAASTGRRWRRRRARGGRATSHTSTAPSTPSAASPMIRCGPRKSLARSSWAGVK